MMAWLAKSWKLVVLMIGAFGVVLGASATVQAAECPGAGQENKVVYFGFDSDKVKESDLPMLKDWATRAKHHQVVCIVGWADKKGNVYLLFERGQKKLYESIAVTRFDLNWVTGGKDWRGLLPKGK